ncbi:threonine/serine ThrE exporter family protein [Plantibacter sp. Mn2098]|uniref:threonine/serine ThrE exporter family protein n=1 Tax=Plantibacter sp. Mn2098 TaxID=3395266 RepID=UPI003BE17137
MIALDEVPPAVTVTPVPLTSWVIAAVVLLVGILIVLKVRRSERTQLAQLPRAAAAPSSPAAVNFAALETVGESMIDAGYTVMTVHSALEDIARVNGYPRSEIVVMPTALFVSARSMGEVRTGVVSSGHTPLLFHQLDDLDRVVVQARTGELDAARAHVLIRLMRTSPPPYPAWVQGVAYVLLCAALAVLLGSSWAGLAVASALGVVVGAALLVMHSLPHIYEPILTVALSFLCAVVVFLLTRSGLDPGVLPSLVAPIVVLLPGGLLTTGVIELATGHMMSGTGRIAAGFMQLVLLAVGIVAGAALVGVPRIDLIEAYQPLGPIAPWIAVAVFGAAVVINRGGRVRSIGWIILVLYIAYAAQVLGNVFFGGVLSAFIGAFAMTPVARFVSSLPSGPAAPVTFLPGFWMLVPGSLGLVGVTTLLDGGSSGAPTVVTTVATMVAIALGVLSGSALTGGARSARSLI